MKKRNCSIDNSIPDRNFKSILWYLFILLISLLISIYGYYKIIRVGLNDYYEMDSVASDILVLDDGETVDIPFSYGKTVLEMGVYISEHSGGKIDVEVLDDNGKSVFQRAIALDDFQLDAWVDLGLLHVYDIKYDKMCMIEMTYHADSDVTDENADNSLKLWNVWRLQTYRIDTFSKVYILCMVSLIGILSFLWFLGDRIQAHTIYLCMAAVMGAVFFLIFPEGTAPDEPFHIRSSYRVSNDLLGIQDDHYGLVMREDDIDLDSKIYLSRNGLNDYYSQLKDGHSSSDLGYFPTVTEKRLFYLFPGFGIFLGRFMKLNSEWTYFLGAFFNYLFFVLCIFYGIRKLPVLKEAIMVWALLPITLQQTTSFSYDCPILAFTGLIFCISISAIYYRKLSKHDLILLLISFAVLSVVKSYVYIFIAIYPLCLLLYRCKKALSERLAVAKKGPNGKRKLICIIIGIVTAVILVGAVGIKAVTGSSLWNDVNQQKIVSWADEPGFVPLYLLGNIDRSLFIAEHTILFKTDFYVQNLFGGTLGWFQIYIPWYLIMGYILVLILTSLGDSSESFEDENKWRFFRIMGMVLCVCSALSIEAAMLFFHTPIQYEYIEGVQGRYFLPFLPFISFWLSGKKIVIRNLSAKRAGCMITFMLILVTFYIFDFASGLI